MRQTTTVESFKSDFKYLSNQLRGLAEPYKLSCLLSGLHEDVRFMVSMFNPRILHIAFGLAKMQEENVATLKKMTRYGPGTSRPNRLPTGPTTTDSRAMVPVQRLIQVWMKERKERGLCYNHDDKWASSHKCKQATFFFWTVMIPWSLLNTKSKPELISQ